jgi:hypothetical protein
MNNTFVMNEILLSALKESKMKTEMMKEKKRKKKKKKKKRKKGKGIGNYFGKSQDWCYNI